MELIAFAAGLVVSTIVWAFVARNNKKHITEVFEKMDEILAHVENEIDAVKKEVKAKVSQAKSLKDIINGQ